WCVGARGARGRREAGAIRILRFSARHPPSNAGRAGAAAIPACAQRKHGQLPEIHIPLCRHGGKDHAGPQHVMIRRIATVGGLTLVSRLTGFIRDAVMAAVLGAGPLDGGFFVPFRLPNHFRAIFAEGAFAAAFVPAYARTLQQSGIDAAKLFADRIAAALVLINLILLALALLFTPWVVSILAPGFVDDPVRFDLA